MAVINTNYSSVIVQNDLTVTNRTLGSAMEQLSTGKRINSAVDDASGLSMSNSRAMQIKGLNQSIRNANDGVSMLQTADGALGQVNNILNRMRELAVQAGNDTNTSKDRYALDQEYQQLNREISRIATNTQWNGMNVLNTTEVGAPGTSSDVTAGVRNVKFHVGANSNQYINIGLKDFSYNLGIPATASETKLTLGDMKDRQFFQFTIKQDAINNGATSDRVINFDLNRPIAAATMTEEELVDFETQLARAINNTDGYSNVSVSRVGNDIFVKDIEGRAMSITALRGGSSDATRSTSTGITDGGTVTNVINYRRSFELGSLNDINSFTVNINGNLIPLNLASEPRSSGYTADYPLYNLSESRIEILLASALNSAYGAGVYSVISGDDNKITIQYGSGVNAPNSMTRASALDPVVNQYSDPKYTKWFTLGDIKGKQYFSLGVGNSTVNFQLSNAIAGPALTTSGTGNEMDAFKTAMQNALNTYSTSTYGSNYYTVGVSGYSIKVDYNNGAHLSALTGGSTVESRGTTWGYAGTSVSAGRTADPAALPTTSSVFSGAARLNDTRISTHGAATVAIGRIDAAMAAVDREQTTLGSVMNRLTHAGDNAGQISRNTTSSRSRLSDADYAAATTEVVRQQIIQQASMAMLAQASQVPNSVITLLK